MSVRAGSLQDPSSPHTSSHQRSDITDLPPPYKERENPPAALARRVARPPNATVEMYNPDVHRGSRRSLDQRVAQTNLGVIRLGCVLLLLGLLVSCTSFVLALVSFNASDTQHLQEQIDTLLSSALEATRSDLSESQTVSQDIGTNLQTLQRKVNISFSCCCRVSGDALSSVCFLVLGYLMCGRDGRCFSNLCTVFLWLM
jgi:hypothetical protein